METSVSPQETCHVCTTCHVSRRDCQCPARLDTSPAPRDVAQPNGNSVLLAQILAQTENIVILAHADARAPADRFWLAMNGKAAQLPFSFIA